MSEEDKNLKPQIIKTLYDLEENLLKKGLKQKDILLLLQERVRTTDKYGGKKKMTLKDIRSVLDGLKKLEREILFNMEKYEEKAK